MKTVFIGIILVFTWMYSTTKLNKFMKYVYKIICIVNLAIDGEVDNFETSVKKFTIDIRIDDSTLHFTP